MIFNVFWTNATFFFLNCFCMNLSSQFYLHQLKTDLSLRQNLWIQTCLSILFRYLYLVSIRVIIFDVHSMKTATTTTTTTTTTILLQNFISPDDLVVEICIDVQGTPLFSNHLVSRWPCCWKFFFSNQNCLKITLQKF